MIHRERKIDRQRGMETKTMERYRDKQVENLTLRQVERDKEKHKAMIIKVGSRL